MRGLLILLVGITFSLAGAARAEETRAHGWSFGLGLGAEVRRVRGPDPKQERAGLAWPLFARAGYGRGSLLLEAEWDRAQASTSGALTINEVTRRVGAWARYEAYRFTSADAFVSLGGGQYLDDVKTTFGSQSDVRHGTRRFVGLGLGVAREVWTRVRFEVEGRVLRTELTNTSDLSGTFRGGVSF